MSSVRCDEPVRRVTRDRVGRGGIDRLSQRARDDRDRRLPQRSDRGGELFEVDVARVAGRERRFPDVRLELLDVAVGRVAREARARVRTRRASPSSGTPERRASSRRFRGSRDRPRTRRRRPGRARRRAPRAGAMQRRVVARSSGKRALELGAGYTVRAPPAPPSARSTPSSAPRSRPDSHVSASSRIAASEKPRCLEVGDEAEAREVGVVVVADPALDRGRRQQPALLVEPDRRDLGARGPGQLVDREAVHRLRILSVHTHISLTIIYLASIYYRMIFALGTRSRTRTFGRLAVQVWAVSVAWRLGARRGGRPRGRAGVGRRGRGSDADVLTAIVYAGIVAGFGGGFGFVVGIVVGLAAGAARRVRPAARSARVRRDLMPVVALSMTRAARRRRSSHGSGRWWPVASPCSTPCSRSAGAAAGFARLLPPASSRPPAYTDAPVRFSRRVSAWRNGCSTGCGCSISAATRRRARRACSATSAPTSCASCRPAATCSRGNIAARVERGQAGASRSRPTTPRSTRCSPTPTSCSTRPARRARTSSIRRARRSAVWVRITPFGRDGPARRWRASDLGVMAASREHVLHRRSRPRAGPLHRADRRTRTPGREAAFAALTALASGLPQRVDVSMQEVVLVANMAAPGALPDTGYRGSRRGANIGRTREIWPTLDGFVSFGLRGGKARVPSLEILTKLVAATASDADALASRDWTTFNQNTATDEELARDRGRGRRVLRAAHDAGALRHRVRDQPDARARQLAARDLRSRRSSRRATSSARSATSSGSRGRSSSSRSADGEAAPVRPAARRRAVGARLHRAGLRATGGTPGRRRGTA